MNKNLINNQEEETLYSESNSSIVNEENVLFSRNTLEEEALNSYLQYSIHVLKRSIPDVRDGLKTVQRRIIFSMSDNKLFFDGKFVKSIKIVGDVLGRFHPHGNIPVYEALVRLAQPFNMRYPLIESQGNFGSADGDNAADARYTEAKLSDISSFLVKSIEKNSVDMIENFDSTELEPVVLPSFLPNILLNGTHGIAVGMMSVMPPHNIKDSLEAVISYIQNNNITASELGEIIKGPDFPTGGILFKEGISEYYERGFGTVTCRGKTKIEDNIIVITEIPFGVKQVTLLEEINILRKRFPNEIGVVKDESNRFGIRICIYIKKEKRQFIPDIEKKLFRYTSLQKKIFFNSLVMLGDKVLLMNLKDVIQHYVDFQDKVFKRSLKFDLDNAKNRLNFLDLLIWSRDHIEEIISILKNSSTNEAIHKALSQYSLSKQNIEKILSIPISRFSRLENDKVDEEKKQLDIKVENLNSLLSDKASRMNTLIERFNKIQIEYEDKRKTSIIEEDSVINMSFVDNHDIYVCMFQNRFFCKILTDDIRVKNIKQSPTKISSLYGNIQNIFFSSEKSNLCMFSNFGRIFRVKPYLEIPYLKDSMIELYDLGSKLLPNEKIITCCNIGNDGYVIFGTEKGNMIKIKQRLIINTHDGTKIIKLNDNDSLSCVTQIDDMEKTDIILLSKRGYAAKFDLDNCRDLNKNTMGVVGMKLSKDDALVAIHAIKNSNVLYIFSHLGFAKGIRTTDLRKTISRGTKGIKTIILTESDYINSVVCGDRDEFTFLGPENIIYRNNIKDLRIYSRNSRGRHILTKHAEVILKVLL